MSIVDRYKMYRKASRKLNEKIIEACLERDVFMRSANLLGIGMGSSVSLRNTYETDVVMDFTINECTVNGRNAIQIYRESYDGDELELDIMDALLSSYTSLFRVASVSQREKLIFVDDIINRRGRIGLIDIGLSKTTAVGMLLFLRLLSFSDFNMTSGVPFVFPCELESYLLREYRKLSKKVESDTDSIKRFVSFFWLSRTHGLEMRYEEKL